MLVCSEKAFENFVLAFSCTLEILKKYFLVSSLVNCFSKYSGHLVSVFFFISNVQISF